MSNATKITEIIDLADLPMIVYGLMVQRTTMSMCQQSIAAKRMANIIKRLSALMPPAAKAFDEGVWCELCCALYENPEHKVELLPEAYYHAGHQIQVTIGNKKFVTDTFKTFQANDETHRSIIETLAQMAPLTA